MGEFSALQIFLNYFWQNWPCWEPSGTPKENFKRKWKLTSTTVEKAHPRPHRTTPRVSTLYTVLLGSTLYTKVWNTPTYKLVINSSWLLGDSGSLEGNLLGIMICSIHGIHSIDIFKTDFSHYLNLVAPDCQIKK